MHDPAETEDEVADAAPEQPDAAAPSWSTDIAAAMEAVRQANEAVHQAVALLEPHFSALSPKARQQLTPVPDGFRMSALGLLHAASEREELRTLCKADPDELRRRIDLVDALGPLKNITGYLNTLVRDAERTEELGVFRQVVALYVVAKTAVRFDGSLATVVAPLKRMFSRRRS